MKNISLSHLSLGISLFLWATFTGCAARPPRIYEWGSYQEQVYEYYKSKDSSPDKQIAALEADIEKIRATGKSPPPGFHAHLGLMYAQSGNSAQARHEFEAEKTLFPESATFMDFLLRNPKKK
jgi:hypothetical protein